MAWGSKPPSSAIFFSQINFADMSAPMMPGGENASKRQSPKCEDICGFLEYKKNFLDPYKNSDKEGQLGFLFCIAFGVDAPEIKEIEDDRMADSIIRKRYCYDDFVKKV
jgi:hypothetical protein